MTDQSIVKEVLAGDRSAYEKLVTKHYKRLAWHIFSMVKDSDTAEDLCQEAFIKAYQALEKYDDKYQFTTWLYRIGTNLALDHLRKKQMVSLDDIPELAAVEPPTENEDERVEALRMAIDGLPLKYQTVISLYYWHNQSYDEIAQVMQVPVGTIKTWLHRSKQELKEMMQ